MFALLMPTIDVLITILFLIIVIPVLQILVFRLPQMRLHRAQRSGHEHHAFKPKLLQHDPIHFLSRRAKIHRWFRHDEPTFFHLRLRNFQHLVYAMRPNIFLQLRIGQIPSIDRSSNDETVNIWNVFRVDTYNRRFRALRAARAVRDQRRRGTLARESDFNRIAAVVHDDDVRVHWDGRTRRRGFRRGLLPALRIARHYCRLKRWSLSLARVFLYEREGIAKILLRCEKGDF